MYQGLTFGQRVGGLGYLSGGDSLRKWYSFRGIGQASSIIVAINAVMLRRSEKDVPTWTDSTKPEQKRSRQTLARWEGTKSLNIRYNMA